MLLTPTRQPLAVLGAVAALLAVAALHGLRTVAPRVSVGGMREDFVDVSYQDPNDATASPESVRMYKRVPCYEASRTHTRKHAPPSPPPPRRDDDRLERPLPSEASSPSSSSPP
mgnify:CR=1 FL=1